MKSLYIYITLLCLMICGACTTIVDVDIPEHESRLVLNSFIHPSDSFRSFVSYSVSSLDNASVEARTLTDATIRVSKDGVFIGQMTYIDTTVVDSTGWERYYFGYFLNGVTPEAGHTYRFDVSHPDYPPANAETTLPPAPVVNSATIEPYVVKDANGSYQSILRMSIDDPAGVENYYELVASIEFEQPTAPGVYSTERIYYAIENTGYSTTNGGNLLLKDALFDGKQNHELSLLCYLPFSYQDEPPNINITKIKIELRALDEAYYRYQLKIWDHLNSSGNDLPIFSGQPVEMYDNVEEGYGVLGSYTSSFYEF